MNILIADDHVLIRDGINKSLSALSSDINILEAGCGADVLRLVKCSDKFDIILLDLIMPDTNGFELLRKLCNTYPDVPVVILSASEEYSSMRKSLDIGASGFIPKTTPREVMISAIKLVLSGGVYIPPDMINHKTTLIEVDDLPPQFPSSVEQPDLLSKLTERQFEVLSLLGQGMQNKEIARTLGVSEHTVKVHVTAVLKLLGVNNRTQAVLAAQNLGLSFSHDDTSN